MMKDAGRVRMASDSGGQRIDDSGSRRTSDSGSRRTDASMFLMKNEEMIIVRCEAYCAGMRKASFDGIARLQEAPIRRK
jgi:hypothetical protein